MAITPEGRVLRELTRYLDRLRREGQPVWYFKVHGGAFQQSGIPDLQICFGGVAVYCEVKAPGTGRLSLAQKVAMREIDAAGGVTGVATGVADLQSMLRIAAGRTAFDAHNPRATLPA